MMRQNKRLRNAGRVGLLLICAWVLATGAAWAQRYGGSRGGMGSRSSANYPSGTSVGGATVSIDPETRKLIVVTDETTAQYISQVVSNLDRPAPQVLIKVVFLECTYRNGSDIGIEGGMTKGLNGGASATAVNGFGLGGITSAATGLVTNPFGQPVQSFNPNGAGLYQIMGQDYQATLRAIATAGKLEVLSRPSVLARNNQQAYITVGQQVPLITNVRYDNFGNQINGVSYQNVGIILRVTPYITSESMVEMIVSPEISNLSDQTVPVAQGVSAPVINSRAADTVVLTPDGQPVVIGGLMSNSRAQSESKIPLLGDIPVLGVLFKRKIKDDSKTELLIFLTPYIVKQPSQLASYSDKERANMELVPKSFSEHELDRFLNTVPANDPKEKDEGASKKKKK